MLTASAILGWIILAVSLTDAIFNNGKLMEWTFIKL